ncbi:hypothetical protein [Marinobacter shengliensis]|uniref:hypothetical protein n=1 Tax=Marinobacter shengliensis TaxID=1389223 RepID=UPI0011087B1F|nr:hypothetical protein [Marinobacter shengliensis]
MTITIEQARTLLSIQKHIQLALESLASAGGRLDNMGDAEANEPAPASFHDLVKQYTGSRFSDAEIALAIQTKPELISKALMESGGQS